MVLGSTRLCSEVHGSHPFFFQSTSLLGLSYLSSCSSDFAHRLLLLVYKGAEKRG